MNTRSASDFERSLQANTEAAPINIEPSIGYSRRSTELTSLLARPFAWNVRFNSSGS